MLTSIFLVAPIAFAAAIVSANVDNLKRSKRWLIYPRQDPTRFQFIAGIGIPADLPYESVTTGYVLKAEYWLPYNATVFRENPFWPEYQVDESYARKVVVSTGQDSGLRWAVYKFLADRLSSHGYNGLECVLKAVCEANMPAMHFDRDHGGVFGELMHLLFSPSTSRDLNIPQGQEFFEAERLGSTKNACHSYQCDISLLKFVSKVLNV